MPESLAGGVAFRTLILKDENAECIGIYLQNFLKITPFAEWVRVLLASSIDTHCIVE